jgi:hypothetical protein
MGKAERTPQGGVRAPAYLTRVGVLTYRDDDGQVVRELRPRDEVFAPESLATLRGAPVTDLHPPALVRADNYRELSRGHVGDDVREDGGKVAAVVVVQDADLVAKIDSRRAREVSCGYTCQIDPTPGEYEGERYDQIQRQIRYNHVALGPEGWGRAGSEVALRIDSRSGDAIPPGADAPKNTHANGADAPRGKDTRMLTIKIDGVEYPLGTDAEKEAAAKAHSRALDAAQGRLDALTAELEAARKGLAEATDAKRLDAAVAARVALVDAARKVLGGDYRADGKTDREVMIDAVVAADAAVKLDGKSDDYVLARFEVAVASRAENHGLAAANDAAVKANSSTRADADSKHPRDRMIEANANAWRSTTTAAKA